jgi:biotin carboxylase
MLEDPWRDRAIAIRFHDEDAAVASIVDSEAGRRVDGVLVVGDRPTVIAARVSAALGLPGHSASAAAAARDKQRTRERLAAAGLPVPFFTATTVDADAAALAGSVPLPVVVKPVALSGSRGVMRADTPAAFVAAFDRLRSLLRSPDIRAEQNDAHRRVLIESFIPGAEYALEGLMHHGALQVLAVFDKPDPLDGPFFEETIYVTPSSSGDRVQGAIVDAVARAAHALGLTHGPVHAECRVNERGVFVLEAAARPIGGLCARALRFERSGASAPLEELLLRHALGEDPREWRREADASGVMMIPIPHRGVFRRVDGLDAAARVDGIDDVRITAKPDQLLLPLPEGASYLGFIFARGAGPREVERSLRDAHSRLAFTIDPEIPVARVPDPLQSHHG